METATKPNVTISISDKAAAQVKKLLSAESADADGVRVAVQGGGCSGLVYKLLLEKTVRPEDKVYEELGIKIYVDKKSVIYLAGTELDFSDGLNGKGFVFANPNAKKSCGCGNSFSV